MPERAICVKKRQRRVSHRPCGRCGFCWCSSSRWGAVRARRAAATSARRLHVSGLAACMGGRPCQCMTRSPPALVIHVYFSLQQRLITLLQHVLLQLTCRQQTLQARGRAHLLPRQPPTHAPSPALQDTSQMRRHVHNSPAVCRRQGAATRSVSRLEAARRRAATSTTASTQCRSGLLLQDSTRKRTHGLKFYGLERFIR